MPDANGLAVEHGGCRAVLVERTARGRVWLELTQTFRSTEAVAVCQVAVDEPLVVAIGGGAGGAWAFGVAASPSTAVLVHGVEAATAPAAFAGGLLFLSPVDLDAAVDIAVLDGSRRVASQWMPPRRLRPPPERSTPSPEVASRWAALTAVAPARETPFGEILETVVPWEIALESWPFRPVAGPQSSDAPTHLRGALLTMPNAAPQLSVLLSVDVSRIEAVGVTLSAAVDLGLADDLSDAELRDPAAAPARPATLRDGSAGLALVWIERADGAPGTMTRYSLAVPATAGEDALRDALGLLIRYR